VLSVVEFPVTEVNSVLMMSTVCQLDYRTIETEFCLFMFLLFVLSLLERIQQASHWLCISFMKLDGWQDGKWLCRNYGRSSSFDLL